jgi:hypothetical protein
LLLSLTAVISLHVTPAAAQAPSDASSAATQAGASDDAAALDPAEPDYFLVNLPTTLRLPVRGSNFHLTHRFNENLRNDPFKEQLKNLFGIDEGATIGLELRFGLLPRLQAIAARTNNARTIQFSAKYDAVHQTSAPVSASVIASVEGQENFSENFSPALGLVLSRSVANAVALYAVPVWVGNSASGAVADQNTGYVGLGVRIRFLPTAYLVGEVTPRLGGYVVGDPEYAFSIEKRVGAHVFSLTFANGQGTTFAQLARGGNPSALYFGFNLTRKFF